MPRVEPGTYTSLALCTYTPLRYLTSPHWHYVRSAPRFKAVETRVQYRGRKPDSIQKKPDESSQFPPAEENPRFQGRFPSIQIIRLSAPISWSRLSVEGGIDGGLLPDPVKIFRPVKQQKNWVSAGVKGLTANHRIIHFWPFVVHARCINLGICLQ